MLLINCGLPPSMEDAGLLQQRQPGRGCRLYRGRSRGQGKKPRPNGQALLERKKRTPERVQGLK